MSTGNRKEVMIMKKTIAILSVVAALVACTKVASVVEEPSLKENQEIKVNITISRTEMDIETKANIKSGWADNDVVYVFFSEATAPAYLEMKYNSSLGWTADPKNYLNLASLDGSGTISAVYLPYGSEYKVIADGTSYTIKSKVTDGEDYSGHFYYCAPQSYTISESTLRGNISLIFAAPENDGDVLVHFDVTNADGSEYLLYQEYMKPIMLSSISASGVVDTDEGLMGEAIPGYKDASFVSFSGVLDKNYKSNNPYWFSIRDAELGTLYYRDAGSHAISANKYIGLGELTDWNVATPGTFSVSGSSFVTIARSNLSYLGATGEEGKKWQLMKYPWSTIESGSSFTPSSSVDFSLFGWGTSGWSGAKELVTTWTSYEPWSYDTWSDGSAPYGKTHYGPADGSPLTEDYANGDWGVYNTTGGRHIYNYGGSSALVGTWRSLTYAEAQYLIENRSLTYSYAKGQVNGLNGAILFPDSFSKPDGVDINSPNTASANYTTNIYSYIEWNKLESKGTVFLPETHRRNGSTLLNGTGGYWLATANPTWPTIFLGSASDFQVTSTNLRVSFSTCYVGQSVRLVSDVVEP